tara:strand:- start:14793 stop:14912 length:120 start_codon:yes stop_codon:yes gene_type:complete
MFMKRVKVGELHREVVDWDQVAGAILISVIVIVILANLG